MTPEDRALLATLPADQHDRNGIPSAGQVADAERALAAATDLLGDLLLPGGVQVSPLGAGWGGDLDLHLRAWPDPEPLQATGWVPVGGVLRRIGSDGQGRWAVTGDGRVLAAIDLHVGPPPNPVSALLRRCQRRGEVRLREVLELRQLARRGERLPWGHPVLAAAADVEATLGGHELGRWATGQPRPCPAPLATRRLRRRLGRLRRQLRPRLVVAVSGVDGAGKSTLCERLAAELRRAGVPAEVVWTRPGMHLEWLRRPAAAVKRFLGQSADPEMRRIAAGVGGTAPSRRGLLGWLWALVVVLAFLAGVWRRQLRAHGVVVYDRHLADALVTLDVLYGSVPLGLHRALIGLVLPRAAFTCYLLLPAAMAHARKPGDLFSREVIDQQLAAYGRWLAAVPDVEVLDAAVPTEELALHLLRRVAAIGSTVG